MIAETEAALHQGQVRAFEALGKRTATACGSKIAILVALVMVAVLSAGISQQTFESDLFALCTYVPVCLVDSGLTCPIGCLDVQTDSRIPLRRGSS